MPTPTHEEFRKVGYTGEAAAFPLTKDQQARLAHYNGIRPEAMPEAWCYAPNEAVRQQIGRLPCHSAEL